MKLGMHVFLLISFLVQAASAAARSDCPRGDEVWVTNKETEDPVWRSTRLSSQTLYNYIRHLQDHHIQLNKRKIYRLDLLIVNLTDLAALKKSMAEQLRCVDDDGLYSTVDQHDQYDTCWKLFRLQNRRFGDSLRNLEAKMTTFDPGWASRDPGGKTTLNGLFWADVMPQNLGDALIREGKNGYLSVDVLASTKSNRYQLSQSADYTSEELNAEAEFLAEVKNIAAISNDD